MSAAGAGSAPEAPLIPTGAIFIRNKDECVWASINERNPRHYYSEVEMNFADDNPLLVALQKCIREFTDRTGLDFETVWSAACTCAEGTPEPELKEQMAIRSNVDLMIHLYRAGFLDLTGKEVSTYPCLTYDCYHTYYINTHEYKSRDLEKDWKICYEKAVSTPIRPLFHVWCNKGEPIVISPQMLKFALICLKFNYDDCCDDWNSDSCLDECTAWKYEFHGEKVLFNPSA
jgi:hypothetical protein